MRLVAMAVVAAFAVSAVSIADAAPRKKRVAYVQPGPGSTVITSQDERGRVRTKILVQKRSYLDGGTEVIPGERKFTDYAIPPGYSGIETVLGPGKGYDRQPFNGPFDVPNNPRYSW